MAVLDINMPKLTGLEVLETLEADGLATRVVFLTGTARTSRLRPPWSGAPGVCC